MTKEKQPEQKSSVWNLEETEAKLKERMKKKLKEQGKEMYYTLEQGETKVSFDLTKEPRIEDGDFGPKTIARVTIEGQPYDLSMSDALTKRVIKAIKSGNNPMTIIRVGEEKQTRFSIKEMAKKKQ